MGGIAEDEIRQRKEGPNARFAHCGAPPSWALFPGAGLPCCAAAIPLLAEADEQIDIESRAARLILAQAVEAPIRQMLANAGYDPSEALRSWRSTGEGRL